MKLIRLYIKDHLLLHDLDIRFDRSGRLDENETYRLDFLVGVNGSGKSTLLRTLVEIFISLQTGVGAQYPYLLEYELDKGGQPLKVFIDKHWMSDYKLWHVVTTAISSDGTPHEFVNDVIEAQYLPEHIVVYTTGSEEEWFSLLNSSNDAVFLPHTPEDILKDPVERAILELPGHIGAIDAEVQREQGELPFILLRGSRLNTITLCGLLRYQTDPENPSNRPLEKVLEAIGIEKIPGFSLLFRIYDRLSPKSTYEELLEIHPIEIRQGSDRLLPFDLTGENNLAQLILEKTNGAFGLFQRLDSLKENDPTGGPTLQQVNIFLQRNEVKLPVDEDDGKNNNYIPGVFLLDWLSDGEKAFLGRMSLLAMLDMEDSLIILDEPEAHFNDFWKREVINLLDMMLSGYHDHVLITTHSSIMLSDITESQAILLSKNEFGWAEQIIIRESLFATDPSDIMVSWFDTKKSVGAFATRFLTEALERGDKEELQKLLNFVGPGYWRYRIQDRLEEINASSG